MAIAPSRLGDLVLQAGSSREEFIRCLRQERLVREGSTDDELWAAFLRAHEENEALGPELRMYNTVHERVRVFLAPYLTLKGRRWAVPLESLRSKA